MKLGDRIVVLSAGRVMQVGSPRELYERPANLFVAHFIGSPKMNVMRAEAVPALAALGANHLGVRPEHVGIVPLGEGHVTGRVQLVKYLGSDTFMQVECTGEAADAGTLVVRAPGSAGIDEDVALHFDPACPHRFATDGTALRPD